MAIFLFFKMAAAAILDFQNLKFFNSRNGEDCRTASVCQITLKSLKPRPRYVSFNIMLVWLENAYSRPLLFGGSWSIFPLNDVTRCSSPQKDRPWAEPRHLSDQARISVALFDRAGRWNQKKGQDRTEKSHKRLIFHIFVEKPPVKRCT